MMARSRSSPITWTSPPRKPAPNTDANRHQPPQDAPRPDPALLPRQRHRLIRGPENRPRDGPRPRALEKLTVELPGYLMDAIKRDAIDRHSTARHVVLLALQSAGFRSIPPIWCPTPRAAKP